MSVYPIEGRALENLTPLFEKWEETLIDREYPVYEINLKGKGEDT